MAFDVTPIPGTTYETPSGLKIKCMCTVYTKGKLTDVLVIVGKKMGKMQLSNWHSINLLDTEHR